MPSVQRTFRVDPSPAVVIDYLKDFSRSEKWDPGTVRCTRKDDGPIAVGARWHNTSKIFGVTTKLTYTLDQLSADTLVFVGTNSRATSRDSITVRPAGAGSGCELTYRADLTMHGGAKLISPIMSLVLEKLAADTMRQLTDVLNGLG